MTLGQLKDLVQFEAQLQDFDSWDGWFDPTIGEVLDDLTAQVKYDELYIQNVTVTAVAATSNYILPSDLQRLDVDNIRFRYQGDTNKDVILLNRKNVYGENLGLSRYVTRYSPGSISVFPYSELTTADQIIYNYWVKPSSLLISDTSIIVPDVLVTTLKREMIARASMFGTSKIFGAMRELANESHNRSFGAIDTGSNNG